MMRIRFQGDDHELQFAKYPNGRIAIMVGDDVAVATTNVPDAPLGQKQVLIKDYSENEGMLRALQEAGIVRVTGETIRTGFVEIPVCEIIVPVPEKAELGAQGCAKETYERILDAKAQAPAPVTEKDKNIER